MNDIVENILQNTFYYQVHAKRRRTPICGAALLL